MTSQPSLAELRDALETTVTETLAYFAGPGQRSAARLDRWGAWETLAHFLYWHDATAWGIASAGRGGPPWPLPASADAINDTCLRLRTGESFDDLIGQLRQAQARLVRVAGEAGDLNAAAFRRPDGGLVSVRERLATIARHWRGHLQALQAADA